MNVMDGTERWHSLKMALSIQAHIKKSIFYIHEFFFLENSIQRKTCIFLFIYLFIYFGYIHGMWKFLGQGQGLNPCHSGDLSHHSDNARYLTHCTAQELQRCILFLTWGRVQWFNINYQHLSGYDMLSTVHFLYKLNVTMAPFYWWETEEWETFGMLWLKIWEHD